MRRLRLAAVGGAAVALCAATSALGGSGVGATFNLGKLNSVDARSVLTGTPSTGTSMLEVSNGSSLAGSYAVFGHLTSASSPSNSAGVRGVGLGSAPGIWGSQTAGTAVYGNSADGYGVRGTASTGTGVKGTTASNDPAAAGVSGISTNLTPGGTTAGVRGENESTSSGTGVFGLNHGSGPGVWGMSQGGGNGIEGVGGVGVQGLVNINSPNAIGVEGFGGGYGIYGTSSAGIGVYGTSPSHPAVEGVSSGNRALDGESTSGTGVYATSSTGLAGDLVGDVVVTGNLTVGSCTGCTSPALHAYNGGVRTDARGFATVQMPHRFHAKGRSFRYQLTIVGTRGWNARVAQPIRGGRFVIQTDRPDVRVSWQVTAVR